MSLFTVEIFCLTVPKTFVGQPFSVSLISGIINFHASESNVTIFCRFFFSQCRKNSQGNPSVLCFGRFPVSNRIMDKKVWRVSIFSVENFLSHSAEKCSRGTL